MHRCPVCHREAVGDAGLCSACSVAEAQRQVLLAAQYREMQDQDRARQPIGPRGSGCGGLLAVLGGIVAAALIVDPGPSRWLGVGLIITIVVVVFRSTRPKALYQQRTIREIATALLRAAETDVQVNRLLWTSIERYNGDLPAHDGAAPNIQVLGAAIIHASKHDTPLFRKLSDAAARYIDLTRPPTTE